MYRYIYQFLGLIYIFFWKINWFKYWKYRSKKSKNVVWIYPCFPGKFFEYMGRSMIVTELGFVHAFIALKKDFRVVIGKKIGKTTDSNIFYHISHEFTNIYRFIEYPPFLLGIIKGLERQGNNCFISSAELEYWENKDFMHQKFSELGINQPETYILNRNDLNTFSKLQFPYIIKEVNSQGGKGLHIIKSAEDLDAAIEKLVKLGKYTVLVQRIVNMSRDLRVVIIGSKIEMYYWRINNSKEWQPTSTSRGSSVDFGNFPEKWASYFVECTQKMGLTAAAYDVAWEHDDVNTTPVILEVSPYFQPNPVLPAHLSHIPYKNYKRKLFTRKPFFKERINIVFEINRLRVLNHFLTDPDLKQSGRPI